MGASSICVAPSADLFAAAVGPVDFEFAVVNEQFVKGVGSTEVDAPGALGDQPGQVDVVGVGNQLGQGCWR